MEAFVFKLSFNTPHELTDSSLVEVYLVDNYTKETFIDKSSFSSTEGAKFTYLQNESDGKGDKLVYLMAFNSSPNANDVNLSSNNGTHFLSNRYDFELNTDGELDIYEYTGSDSELSLLLNRMTGMCESYDLGDDLPSLSQLDDWISNNSKNYSVSDIVNLKETVKGKRSMDHQLTAIDCYPWFDSEIGNWIVSDIDSKLSTKMNLSEFITNHCE